MNTHKAISWGIVASLVLLVWIPLHVFYSGLPKDFPNEPDGFGGLTWGTSFYSVREEMTPAKKEGFIPSNWNSFHRKDNLKHWEGFEVVEVVYFIDRESYTHKGLNQVNVNFRFKDFEALAKRCQELWGKAKKYEVGGKPYYEWHGRTTTIVLTENLWTVPFKMAALRFYTTEEYDRSLK